MGETIQAYVVLRRQHAIDERRQIKFAKEYLADYKAPKRIRFVEDLKRNELGKVTAINLSAVKEVAVASCAPVPISAVEKSPSRAFRTSALLPNEPIRNYREPLAAFFFSVVVKLIEGLGFGRRGDGYRCRLGIHLKQVDKTKKTKRSFKSWVVASSMSA